MRLGSIAVDSIVERKTFLAAQYSCLSNKLQITNEYKIVWHVPAHMPSHQNTTQTKTRNTQTYRLITLHSNCVNISHCSYLGCRCCCHNRAIRFHFSLLQFYFLESVVEYLSQMLALPLILLLLFLFVVSLLMPLQSSCVFLSIFDVFIGNIKIRLILYDVLKMIEWTISPLHLSEQWITHPLQSINTFAISYGTYCICWNHHLTELPKILNNKWNEMKERIHNYARSKWNSLNRLEIYRNIFHPIAFKSDCTQIILCDIQATYMRDGEKMYASKMFRSSFDRSFWDNIKVIWRRRSNTCKATAIGPPFRKWRENKP